MQHRTLLTGGSGFLGSALARRLVARGDDLVVFDNNSRGSRARLETVWDRLTFIEGDVRDTAAVAAAAGGCDILYHLAFVNGTRFFYEQPRMVLDVGIRGALNTLEAALASGVKTYILASSSEVYQQPTLVPTPEDERAIIPDVRNPRFSYAGGKLISELMALNYLRDSGVRNVIFRPHNVFGPNMGFEHVIPELMRKLFLASQGWTKRDCLIDIQGTGEETRAFCYVEDAVDQIVLAEAKGPSGEVFHIGQESERTIREMIAEMAAVLGLRVTVKPGDLRSGGTTRRCPAIGKIRALGYDGKDRYAEGLRETVLWYRDHFSKKPPP